MKKILILSTLLFCSGHCFSATMTVRFITVTGVAAYHIFQRGTSQVAVACSTTAYASLSLPGAQPPTPQQAGDIWLYSTNGSAFNVGEPSINDCLMMGNGDAFIILPTTGNIGWRMNWYYLDKATYHPVQANAVTLSTTIPVPANAVGQ